jgi:hypothetical protein
MPKPAVSADSHVTEPPGTYVDRIDKAYKEKAPRMHFMEGVGDVFTLDGCSGLGNAEPIPNVVGWRGSRRQAPRCKVAPRR